MSHGSEVAAESAPPPTIPVGDVPCALFSGDGKRIVFCLEIGVWLLDAPSGRAAPIIHRGVIGEGGAINHTGDRFVVLEYAAATVHRVTLLPDGRTTNAPLRCEALLDAEGAVLCDLDPDGRWIVLGTEDGDVTVLAWDGDVPSHQVHLPGYEAAIFSRDGDEVLLLGDDEMALALVPHSGARSDDDDRFESASDAYVTRAEQTLSIDGPPERDGFMVTVRTGSRTLVLGPPGGVPIRAIFDGMLSWDGRRVWLHVSCDQPAGDHVLVYDAATGDWLGFWHGVVNEAHWDQLGTVPINPFGFDDGESVAGASPVARSARGEASDVSFDGHSSLLVARFANGLLGRADGKPLSQRRWDDRDVGVRAVGVLTGREDAEPADKVPMARAPRVKPADLATRPTSPEDSASSVDLAQAELLELERSIGGRTSLSEGPRSRGGVAVVLGAIALLALWWLTR